MKSRDYKWHSRMLMLAYAVSTFSKDPSTKVGCVIYNPRRFSVLTTGYNGFPRQTNDDMELYAHKPTKYARVVHAEANAITEAAVQGISLAGSSIATTHKPCADCAGLLIQAGIAQIIYADTGDDMLRHDSDIGDNMLAEAGISALAMKPTDMMTNIGAMTSEQR